jgi:hypothetical protein
MKMQNKKTILLLVIIFACILINCNKNGTLTFANPVLSSFDKKLIENGLCYCDVFTNTSNFCDCDSTLKTDKCRIYGITEGYIPKILSQSPNNALRSILNHIRSFADCIEEPHVTFHPDSLIGMCILLYFYDSEAEDQVIRDFFSKDSNALSIFFSPSTHIDKYAWIYNRPDPAKWVRMLDSLNDHPERWKNIQKLYSKRYLKNTKFTKADTLQNPFRTNSYSEMVKNGDNQWINSMKIFENKMNDTDGYSDSILFYDYQTIALIQIGLEYPINWDVKPENCSCGSYPDYEECRLFCSTANSLSRLLRQCRNLEKILSDMASFAAINTEDVKRELFIGTGVLLYYFNNEMDDQCIRKFICNDTNIRRLFFAVSGRLGGFAWISNRKNKKKWASFIDSLNTELVKGKNVDPPLYNPFREFMTNAVHKEDSVALYNRMHALEMEIDKR